MITKEDALTATEFHEDGCYRDPDGPRGGRGKEHVLRYRRNGKTQTWKRDPDKFRIPVKRGLKEYANITEIYQTSFHTAETCPLTVQTYTLKTGAVVSLSPIGLCTKHYAASELELVQMYPKTAEECVLCPPEDTSVRAMARRVVAHDLLNSMKSVKEPQ